MCCPRSVSATDLLGKQHAAHSNTGDNVRIPEKQHKPGDGSARIRKPRAGIFDTCGDSIDTAGGQRPWLRRCAAFGPQIRLVLSNAQKRMSAMRWPLRNQIMLPMVGVILASLVAVSVLNAFLSVRRTHLRIERELNEVATTLADATFPLTDGVLGKMRGLSGTEFVMIQQDGLVAASSSPGNSFVGLSELTPVVDRDQGLGDPVSLECGRFFHKSLRMARGTIPGQPATLHILYPEESYREAWRDAAYPPLVVGSVALLLVVAFAAGIASQVTRPLRRLQTQVGEIAEGEFQAIPVRLRDDEIADLSRSINQMAEMLAKYESNIRQSERLRTLGQLGAGIAHQMRNSATGCRMAIELHARQCPERHDESLDVAKHQLELMESYLQRFLRLGRSDSTPHRMTDLGDVVTSAISLVHPMARHVGVELEWKAPGNESRVLGDAETLEQMLINVLVNAIEAAAAETSNPAKQVRVTIRCRDDRVAVEVWDTGDGPPDAVHQNLFEPFVTGKPDGVGLGLSVASEIAISHQGEIRWQRRESRTCFSVEFPTLLARGEAASNDENAGLVKSGV